MMLSDLNLDSKLSCDPIDDYCNSVYNVILHTMHVILFHSMILATYNVSLYVDKVGF